MKRLIYVIALFLIFSIFSFTGCGRLFDDSVPRDEIFAYVNENYEKLEDFPYDELKKIRDSYAEKSYEERVKGEQMAKDFVREQLGGNSIVKDVYAFNENILDFDCGGYGIATDSTYTGFYFSKDDTPFAMGFDQYEFTELSPGVYEWKNEDGSHRTYTEKIRDNWYYYVQDYY